MLTSIAFLLICLGALLFYVLIRRATHVAPPPRPQARTTIALESLRPHLGDSRGTDTVVRLIEYRQLKLELDAVLDPKNAPRRDSVSFGPRNTGGDDEAA